MIRQLIKMMNQTTDSRNSMQNSKSSTDEPFFVSGKIHSQNLIPLTYSTNYFDSIVCSLIFLIFLIHHQNDLTLIELYFGSKFFLDGAEGGFYSLIFSRNRNSMFFFFFLPFRSPHCLEKLRAHTAESSDIRI